MSGGGFSASIAHRSSRVLCSMHCRSRHDLSRSYRLVFSSASATAFLRDWGSTFIARMKEDRMKQMLFDTTSGHSRAKMPNVSHRPKGRHGQKVHSEGNILGLTGFDDLPGLRKKTCCRDGGGQISQKCYREHGSLYVMAARRRHNCLENLFYGLEPTRSPAKGTFLASATPRISWRYRQTPSRRRSPHEHARHPYPCLRRPRSRAG
jgi:hypothetical protein